MTERRISLNIAADGTVQPSPAAPSGPETKTVMSDFRDISNERYRRYSFPGDQVVSINMPRLLRVSESGHHYIVDGQERSHIIAPGWIHIYFEVKAGTLPFAF